MAVINLTSEEFADRIEEMFDLADKGDKVLIHHEGKTYTIIPISDEELASMTEKENALSDE
jgi:virulence-associated protein VagC